MQATPNRLRSDASTCRDLASTAITKEAREVLKGMAAQYDEAAIMMEKSAPKAESARRAFDWPQF